MPYTPDPRTIPADAPTNIPNLPAGTSDQPPGMTASDVIPSMPGGMTPQLGTPPPSMQGPPQQKPQTPSVGMPILAKFLGDMFGSQGTRGYHDMGPGQPARPVSRLDSFEGFLGQFLNAFSQGMSASGHGPGANIRGAGAAMQAPYQQALQQYGLGQQQQMQQAQMAQEQARTEQTQEQTRMLGQMVTIQTPYGPQTMPYAIAQKAYPAAISAEGKVQAAKVNRYMPSPFGILDKQTGRLVEGQNSPVGSFVTVTPEMQQQFNLPQQLVGKMVKLTDISSYARGEGSLETVVRGAEDSYTVNKLTNAKTALNVGNPGENRLAWAKYGLQKAQFERDTFGQLFGKFGDAYPSLVSLVDPDGNVLGWKSPAAPTSSIKTQAQQAQDLSKLFTDVRTELAKAQAQGKLGPASGRINEYLTGKVGLDDPLFAKTRALGSLVASGMLKAHFGARGGQEMFGHFESLFNTGRMTIGDLNGALDGFSVFMNQYASRVQTTKPGGPAAAPKGGQPKIQFIPTS